MLVRGSYDGKGFVIGTCIVKSLWVWVPNNFGIMSFFDIGVVE